MERYACDLSTVSIQSHNFENYKSYELFKRVGLRLHSTTIVVPGQLEDRTLLLTPDSTNEPTVIHFPSFGDRAISRGISRAA